MTLQEKILNKFPFTNTEYIREYEQITDDFAVGFAEWVSNSYYSYNFGIKMFEHRNKEIYKTTSELLQIYKKEKGL